MPSDNLEIARRAFEAFAERDVDAALELLDPDAEFFPITGNLTTGGAPYRGHDGIRRYFEDIGRVWKELRIYPEDVRDLGDAVVALGHVHGRGGGMVIDRPTGWLWKIRDGKIVWGRIYASHREALEAAGLKE